MVRWVCVLMAATVAFSASEAAAPESMSFDCDALPGTVSTMDANRLAPTRAISGSLSALQSRHDSNLTPTATVKLASRKDFVALQMTPIERNSSTFILFIRNGDNQQEERTELGHVTLNQAVPFTIAKDGKNVRVEAAGRAVFIEQSFRGTPNVGVSCSTGHFRFDNIRFG